MVPGEDFHPAVAQAVAQGHGRQPLVPPDVRRELLEHVFFSIRAFFLSREMSFGSMTASVRASPYSALLMRESVSFSVEKSMLPPYLQKVMRAYLCRDVCRQPIPQGVGTVLKPPKTPRTDHGAALPTSGYSSTRNRLPPASRTTPGRPARDASRRTSSGTSSGHR